MTTYLENILDGVSSIITEFQNNPYQFLYITKRVRLNQKGQTRLKSASNKSEAEGTNSIESDPLLSHISVIPVETGIQELLVHSLINDLLDTRRRVYDAIPVLEFHVHGQLNTMTSLE